MSAVVSTLPSASARRIVEVAERLFALHGIDGVSLRQIAAAAGTANNSAVNYHFGSKEGLIAAIFQYRLPQLTSERKMLAARSDPDDLRSRFEAYYLPVLTATAGADLSGLYVLSFWVYDSTRADHRVFAAQVRRIMHAEPKVSASPSR